MILFFFFETFDTIFVILHFLMTIFILKSNYSVSARNYERIVGTGRII